MDDMVDKEIEESVRVYKAALELINSVLKWRNRTASFPWPQMIPCVQFAAQEVAEAMSCAMQEDQYYLRREDKGYWRDCMLRELGDAAAMIASALYLFEVPGHSSAPMIARHIHLETADMDERTYLSMVLEKLARIGSSQVDFMTDTQEWELVTILVAMSIRYGAGRIREEAEAALRRWENRVTGD